MLKLNITSFLNLDVSHLSLSRWPKFNSVRPLDNMKTIFKFEVNWGNGFKDISFTGIYKFKQYIYLKSSMAAILNLAHGSKSIASVL